MRPHTDGTYARDAPGAHLMAARPVFRRDHNGQLAQVPFNNYERAPFLLPEDEMIAFYDALRVFDTPANDPAMQWRHVLAPDEALLFDNWRVLHGRFVYTGGPWIRPYHLRPSIRKQLCCPSEHC